MYQGWLGDYPDGGERYFYLILAICIYKVGEQVLECEGFS